MPTITAQSIVDRAETALFDETNVRWAAAELLTYLNDGQREIVMLKPNAYTKNEAVQLVAGTKQTIPADGIQLVDVPRNMGTDGLTPGRAVWEVNRKDLDRTRPDWHSETADAAVKHFMFDPRDPKVFYVTPPQPAANQGYVEEVYSATPAEVAIDAVITLDDIYQTPLFYYIMFRALTKETEESQPEVGASYRNLFMQAVAGKAAAEAK